MIFVCNIIIMKPSRNGPEDCPPRESRQPAAFLLAQVGAHAASKFAERLAALDLSPPDAGVLRILASKPAITQQALASHLGVLPSRLVGLVDDLEARGLIE